MQHQEETEFTSHYSGNEMPGSQALSMLWILKFLTGKKTTLKIKRHEELKKVLGK